jgi:hypothetical protein
MGFALHSSRLDALPKSALTFVEVERDLGCLIRPEDIVPYESVIGAK